MDMKIAKKSPKIAAAAGESGASGQSVDSGVSDEEEARALRAHLARDDVKRQCRGALRTLVEECKTAGVKCVVLNTHPDYGLDPGVATHSDVVSRPDFGKLGFDKYISYRILWPWMVQQWSGLMIALLS
mmetsp:Transcript_51970/g.117239  ORF Transcript_51970/g.117239 Transcript_51970/m.117239 type:complete len:129 (-) Transcript_51970:153-539(-)